MMMTKRVSKNLLQGGKGFPCANRSLFRDVAIIYILTLVVSLPFYFWKLNKDLSSLGEESLLRIDRFVEQTAMGLAPFVAQKFPCVPKDVAALRKTVFHSYRVKEIGLINQDNTVYCTSYLGPTSIRIRSGTITRWENSPNHRTVTLTRSKTGRTNSFFVYIRGSNGMGANALIPPSVLDELVSHGIAYPELPFVVTVAGKPFITPHNKQIDWQTDSPLDTLSFISSQNPIEVTFRITSRFTFNYIFEHYWISVLLGSLFSLLYAYIHHRRMVRQSLPATFEWALNNKELEVYFQPIVDTNLGGSLGFELLLRWHHPVHGIISPLIFIPLAEQLGKISALTDFVLDTAIDFIRNYPALMQSRYLSVNISRHLLLDEQFAERFCQRCGTDKLITQHLLLEITEELAFTELEMTMVIAQLEKLQACGFRIAVDDFGTGYSGLDLIRRFPFDVVKIDKVFIKDLREDGTAIPLLDSMIGLARRLDMTIIAEGVETAQQADSLMKRGVNYHQGFYYAKPMPLRMLKKWLKTAKQIETSGAIELVQEG